MFAKYGKQLLLFSSPPRATTGCSFPDIQSAARSSSLLLSFSFISVEERREKAEGRGQRRAEKRREEVEYLNDFFHLYSSLIAANVSAKP